MHLFLHNKLYVHPAKIFFALFLFIIMGRNVYSQNTFDSVCCSPFEKRVEWLNQYYRQISKLDTESALKTIANLNQYASTRGKEFVLEAMLIEANYLEHHLPEQREKIFNLMDTGVEDALKFNYKNIALRFLHIKERYSGKLEDYQLKFSVLDQIEYILETSEDSEIYNRGFYYIIIANTYYRFQEYREAMKRLQIIIDRQEEANKHTVYSIWHAYNTMGLCYRKLNIIDSSNYFFDKARNIDYVKKYNRQQYAIATGNLGINKYLQGDFDEAVPMLQVDISESLQNNDVNNAVGSLTALADIRLQKNQLERAKQTLDSIAWLIQKHRIEDRKAAYFPVIAKWYQLTGNTEEALKMWDSALVSQREYDHKYNKLKLTLFSQQLETSNFQAELTRQQNKLKVQNLYSVIIGLLLISSVVYVLMYRKKEQKIKALKLKETRQELEIAQLQLNEYTQKLIGKNRQIENLEKQIKSDQQWELIDELKSGTLLTQEDWDNFRHKFERVHRNFIDRLLQKYPGLTPSEQRLILLTKLKLSQQEMALMLGVSQETLRVANYRLRQKLGIENKRGFHELISRI